MLMYVDNAPGEREQTPSRKAPWPITAAMRLRATIRRVSTKATESLWTCIYTYVM